MYVISTLSHIRQLKLEVNVAEEFSDIISSEFSSLMSAYLADATADEFSLKDHDIRFFVLEEEREFFALIASFVALPILRPHMYITPEFVETLYSGQTKVCKLCYLLDNECFVIVYALHTERIAAWIHNHIEGSESNN